ncbi:MAG: cell surface protein SprA [Crocinitomicaceae bacterium]|nr:cell surface protein SprA [Crocinitomicaceae bacterium]
MRIRIGIIFLVLAICYSTQINAQNDSLRYPINQTFDPTQTQQQSFDLGDPSNVQQTIVYDPVTGTYVFKETIGVSGMDYRPPSMMTLEEYLEYDRQKSIRDNWKDRIDEQTADSQPFDIPIKIKSKLFKNIFGSDQITIKPQGTVEIGLGVNSSRYDNPLLPVKQRRITRFDFNQNINFSVVGQIGTRVKLRLSYNTQANFEFENVQKLEYTGDEDQIIQSIALGNVSLDLPTTLIPSSKTLFGASTKLKFGRTTVDLIAASSKGQRKDIKVQGGAQKQQFELSADQYEANRHYFLNYYFRDHYDEAMKELPIVNSGVNISRLEVWITNKTNTTENTRNIVAFTDLGEGLPEYLEGTPGSLSNNALPDNNANGVYPWASTQPGIREFSSAVPTLSSQVIAPGPFTQSVHYEKVESAKKLTESEFTYNAQLGFISLNMPLNNDEVLAVAYEYTYRGQTYRVGELSTDGVEGTNAIILKLLKPTMTNPKNKLWDLMMKNVYSIGAYQVSQDGFRLNVLYNNPENSLYIPFFPQDGLDDVQIVTLLDMDKLNQVGQPFSDGVFDYVPMNLNGNRFENGGTINARNGRIYFSTVEPFGRVLAKKLLDAGIPQTTVNQLAFTELYDSTKTAAQQIPSKNRFLFKGEYQSSVTSDIPLNSLNVPEGAVSVTAGGARLIEGVDYTVDYNLGRVKILNDGLLASNQEIKVSVESNSAFGFQAKSLFGARIAHRFSKDFNVGATWMRMMERPVTQKVDIGSEPYKNNIIGFDVQFRTELPFLTKLIDKLPVISTKEKSFLTFSGEFAHLIPGQPRAISKSGISYIDDFEGAQSTIDLSSLNAWYLASVPTGQSALFPESSNIGLSKGFKRSKISWYRIDDIFYRNDANTPSNIANDPMVNSDSRTRNVNYQEVFPLQENQYGTIPNLQILEVAYYPKERGMYNYDTTSHIDADGFFTNPQDRWGGIMRAMTTTDFELANIEYIQFWVLDPFNKDAEDANPNSMMTGGDLYFNLGNISEDILPDSRKSFENGLSPDGAPSISMMDTTVWAQIPNTQVTVNAFDNDPQARINQDVGLDGFNNSAEKVHFTDYINWINSNPTLSPAAKARMIADPSSDDYNYYLDDNYDQQQLGVLARYKKYNGMEGNSPTPEMYDTMNTKGYSTVGPRLDPDREDINQDNNLQETENYFQYKVSLKPQDMVVGKNYITNKQTYTKGNGDQENWYQFKIPVRDFTEKINGINDFRSIRFMRMFLKDFDEEVLLRFAKLELVRGEWRRYTQDLNQPGEGVVTDPNLTSFDIGAVNIQENSDRQPIHYIMPPGINREIDPSQQVQRQMNEQSLTLEVCNLKDGDARAAYKNVTIDVRGYKKLKLFVHAESKVDEIPLDNDDLTAFVRLGTDFNENYYEYEVPLKVTSFGATVDTDVWPAENDIEIVFEDLTNLKMKRNGLIELGSSSVSYNIEYVAKDPNYSNKRIKIKGNPNLQGIKTIMIGVRNPKNSPQNPWQDDGMAHCGIIWVNELRLSDFVTEGGSAAIAQAQIQGADFFNISASASYSGTNWGAVDSRIQERQRDQRINANFNSNWQLGQFFGKKFGLALPFFFGYSVGIINPEFDPYNPDIKLNEYDRAERRRRTKEGQDFQERISYNFTNVRKQLAPGAKPAFWRIANWSASYAYSEDLKRDFNIKYDRTKLWTGNLTYSYAFQAKPWEPFKNVFKKDKFKKSKWLALIRDFNLSYVPKNFSFTNDLLRSYNERQVKNNIVPNYEFKPVYIKQFTWNRGYNLGYDLTRNLKLTFTANNRAIFAEPDGQVSKKESPDLYRDFKDSIRTQMRTLGKTMDYSHNYNINYSLPLNKIPALDWTTATITYGGAYNWQRAPLAQPEYGNNVQNNRTINAQTQLNFTNLYNKLPFFKKVLTGGSAKANASVRQKVTSDGTSSNKDQTKKPDTKKGPTAEERFPRPVPPKPEEEMTEKEKAKWDKKIERWEKKIERINKRDEKKKDKVNPVVGFMARLLMTVRNVGATYAQNDGTLLPGYDEETRILGFGNDFKAPMAGFVFGRQRYSVTGKETGFDFARIAAGKGWLVQNENINRQYTNTHTQNITIRATLEPLRDLTIDLSANRMYGNNSTEFFRWNSSTGDYESQSRVDIAQLTYTNVSIGSAFAALGKNYSSKVFQKLLDSRSEVSSLLGRQNANSNQLNSGYYSGYNGTQQGVLVGAFLTSYTNRKISDKNINPIKNMPLPNWSVNYNGLTKVQFMKKAVKSFVIKHAYTSTVSVAGMQTNLNATFDVNDNPTALDINNNFISRLQIQNVTMSERFSPLIGFDATWNVKKQGLITKFEISKERSATLALSNNQVTEVTGTTYTFGTGYKFTNVRLPIKGLKPSDMNFRFDFSLRDNLTVIRKVVENTDQATAGQKVMSIKASLDYNIGRFVILQLYYDQVVNTPKIATAYPTGNMSCGIKIRYNLAGVQ